MTNHYEVAEIVEIGRAQDVILGSSKVEPNFPDSASQLWQEFVTADDE
jgi:hypothetical protein